MIRTHPCITSFFFFNDTATTEIYTLSLHDALPIFRPFKLIALWQYERMAVLSPWRYLTAVHSLPRPKRSEEHTSELQSRQYLVCRLLLEKKKTKPLNGIRFMCKLAVQTYITQTL